ncbi:MAG TPA: sensor histidine kinase [Thermoanaerobaculia bacterium]|nr:sensor histidine kinase [Thermoanaerobaculia bacterium]
MPAAATRQGLRERLLGLAVTSLRWAIGLYCVVVGAFMLVAPHRFGGVAYAALAPFRAWWGTAALAAGAALLALAVLHQRSWLRVAAHGAAGVVLLALAFGFVLSHAWTGVAAYSVLGFGLLGSAPPRRRPPGPRTGGDLLAFLMGVATTLAGAGLVALPQFYAGLAFAPAAPRLLGLGLLLTGPGLAYVQLRRCAPWLTRAAHLAAGGAQVAFGGLAAAAPIKAWTGIALYWGIGIAVALLPWLRVRLARLDTAALRARLALALASATSVPLILAVAVVTSQEERLATVQAITTLAVEASSCAQNVRDDVELNGARATAVAALAGRLRPEPPLWRRLLALSRPRYPDVSALLIVDREGRPLASDGSAEIGENTLRGAVAGLGRRAMPVQLGLDRRTARPLLLLSARIVDAADRPLGALVMALDSAALDRRILRAGSIVSLADGYGNLIARSNGAPGEISRIPRGWDRMVRAGAPPSPAGQLVSYGTVPDFGWVVAVERPSSDALAGVERGRDLAFTLLLLVIPLAVVGGSLAARLIARPLGTLADAVDELTAGNPRAPVESSGISEVERLSAAFRDMRDRLALRTAEGERLAAELRARAEALADADRRKNEFLAMLAHELRNPLGAIATASYVLGEAGSPEPPIDRATAVIQRQVQHLVRLVDDLLDVSRITRGKVELRREPLDLVAVVQQAVETIRPLAEVRRHRLELLLPETPLPLLADATRLEQILVNLMRNAIKFTETGGTIAIAADRDGAGAAVRIRDTGVGIAPDFLPRIFDLFTQGQQGLDRSTGGLGIGLTLVRSLIEMHGGRVEARSEGRPGQGSEFIVWLPLAGDPPPAHTEAAEVVAPLAGSRGSCDHRDHREHREG